MQITANYLLLKNDKYKIGMSLKPYNNYINNNNLCFYDRRTVTHNSGNRNQNFLWRLMECSELLSQVFCKKNKPISSIRLQGCPVTRYNM